MFDRVVVVGGAGFIGSHFVDHFLQSSPTNQVTIFDNFTSGRRWHFAHHEKNSRLRVIEGDVKDLNSLTKSMTGSDTVVHLASNPDIAKAMTDPTIDFAEGTLLTNNVVEAARRSGVELILYASGSGVYGDLGDTEAQEDHGPLIPSSTYGASKLAGEALISSYVAMFGLRGYAFRFGNVVGPRQTHGVGFDFVRRLLADPTSLQILGDGKQSKSYIHVEDVIRAVVGVPRAETAAFRAFNVATGDYVNVTNIAELAVDVLGLANGSVRFEYTGGDRGWKGDVPVVRLNTDRIRATGWRCSRPTESALRVSLEAMLAERRAGR